MLFFWTGLWIWIPVLAVGYWFSRYGYASYHSLLECTFYNVTGFPCPGCGGTRAVYYLFSGDIIKSIRYHPVIIYGVLAYVHFMGLYYYRNFLKREQLIFIKEISVVIYIYVAVAVILIQWVLKIFIIVCT